MLGYFNLWVRSYFNCRQHFRIPHDRPNCPDAATLGLKLFFLQARTSDEITQVSQALLRRSSKAVVVNTDPYYLGRRDHLAELEARHSLPAIHSLREHVTAGGLISYGASLIEAYRLLGGFAGRILRGGKPTKMPGTS